MATARCWSQLYSVNVAEFDDEHQRLFRLMQELESAIRVGRGDAVIKDLLRKMVMYTMNHFASEEELMERHGFPGFASHRFEHHTFTQRLASLQLEHEAGKPGVPDSLMLFLESWLRQHILHTDKQYSEFFNSKGVF